MKCEHGSEVKVVCVPFDDYWDNGPKFCNADGGPHEVFDPEFLPVEGCPDCKVIRTTSG